MKTPESMYEDTWGEFFKQLLLDVHKWWKYRRQFKKADRSKVKYAVQYSSMELHHGYMSADKVYTKNQIEGSMGEIEVIADELGIELRYTKEDLE